MISQAIALSLVTFGGFFIIYSKLPAKVKEFIKNHSLLTDITTLGAAYVLLGGTLTALFAAALVGLITSTALYIGNNKEDFQYLWDAKDMIIKYAQVAKGYLKNLGEAYREKTIGE